MSQGFLIWPDFHPILVGAGCLALGYVYGRHCRACSEDVPADHEAAASENACCCAQSQSNVYPEDVERCKCCISAPAELDTTAVGKGKESKCSTRSPYMIQDAAEGFEQAERSTKRDLGQRNSMDRYGHHMDSELDYTDGEAHGMRQHSSSPYFEKSSQMLEEERVLQTQTPYKKQKGPPVIKEPFCSKGKAEVGGVGDDHEDDAAATVPWSQEVLNKRIDYFNNVSETTDSGRSDESRKLRHFKKKFLKVSVSSKAEATYNSMSTNSQKSTSNSGGVERSTCGLVPLATPDRVDCSHDNNPDSPHRIFGGGRNAATTGDSSDVVPQDQVQHFIPRGDSEAPETLSIVDGLLHTGNDPEGDFKDPEGDSKLDLDRDADAVTQPAGDSNDKNPVGNELESAIGTASFMEAELVQISTPSTTPAPEHHVPDRCSGSSTELKKEVPVDKVLKVEIYGLLNEADCSKVSFQEIVSLLEERLQTDLQESKAHIATLVREVISISKLLEEEGITGEFESETE